MDADNFRNTMTELTEIRPFRIFTIELLNGRRIEVDHPRAVNFRDGTAVFLLPGGIPIIFDHQSLNSIVVAPASTEA